jgi:hypothetical protein
MGMTMHVDMVQNEAARSERVELRSDFRAHLLAAFQGQHGAAVQPFIGRHVPIRLHQERYFFFRQYRPRIAERHVKADRERGMLARRGLSRSLRFV